MSGMSLGKSVLMVVFIGYAAYTIIGGLAGVGFDNIVDAFEDARWSLVIIGLVLAAATNWTDAIALKAVSPKPVPLGVTTVEQFAIGFVNIAVPWVSKTQCESDAFSIVRWQFR